MEHFDWTDCCRRLKAGDKKALALLFRHSFPELTAYARLWLRQQDAEDVAQEIMIALWEKRRQLDETRALRALLFVMARHRAFNRLRDMRPAISIDRETIEVMDNRTLPAAEFPEIEPLEKRVEAWIAELPERRREAFCLSRFNHMRYADIAVIMGISVKTVEQHIGEALRFLRDKIRAFDPDLLKTRRAYL